MVETDITIQLKGIYQKITQIMQVKIDEYGLTFGLLHLIMIIEKSPNASQKELAKEMKFTEGAMSSAVKRLLKLNMLEQVSLESDMRYNRLVVTGKGKLMIADYKDYLFKRYKDMFHGFDYEKLEKFYDLLSDLNMNLDSISNEKQL